MTRKFSFVTLSLILISFIFILPTFADNGINMNINSNTVTNNNSSTQQYSTSSYTSNSAKVTTSSNDDEFGLSNILNIMLVVIGILLVLLAIAILIRLKS